MSFLREEKGFYINNHLLSQVYIQEFEYLTKIFILPKPVKV